MIPVHFPEANSTFGAPPDLDASQCLTIHAYRGQIDQGSVDGAPVVVVAWQPSPDEISAIQAGSPIFVSVLGGLSPHYLCMDFKQAISPR